MPKKIAKILVSLAGEFAVLSQLALRGKDANMTLGNTKGVDILVSDPATGKMLKIEVKTHCRIIRDAGINSRIFGRYLSSWIMSKKHERNVEKADADLFYCFVSITKETKPRFFIVPAKVVAKYIRWEIRHYRKMQKAVGRVVKDVGMRQFRIGSKNHKDKKKETLVAEMYEDNWKFRG